MKKKKLSSRAQMREWVLEALDDGCETSMEIRKWVWNNKKADLRKRGDFFFTWQETVKSAVTELRKQGAVAPSSGGGRVERAK